jgi:PKD repeat protein
MEWIERVQVADLDNPSGASGYTDFTSLFATMQEGSTVNVSLTPGFSGTIYTEYWKIWIDYNGDHDFEDAGEEVFSGVGSSTVTGSFTVQSGVNITTRMRVSMKYAGYPTPCETFTYGEVEDYTADIIPSGIQPPVANFTYTTNGLTAYFTDASSDPIGTIVGWDWDFGDGNTSTEQNPTHTYAADGTYTVTLTVTNNDSLTGTTSKPVTVSGSVFEIYVHDITQTPTITGKNYKSNAVVTIWDTNNNPVADATVSITWSGVVSGSASGVTGADGTVTFVSNKVKSTGPFTITINNVTHATLPYNPALNVETSDTANF